MNRIFQLDNKCGVNWRFGSDYCILIHHINKNVADSGEIVGIAIVHSTLLMCLVPNLN